MDNERLIGDLLQAHGLKRTPRRIDILNLFMAEEFALSANDVIDKMNGKSDRVTIYRALASFEEHGILHRASEDLHGIKYALCKGHCPDEAHTDTHAHFVCDECNQTYCLENVKIPEVRSLRDFSVRRINYTLGGLCKECKN